MAKKPFQYYVTEIDKLEPHLKKTVWPPMTYMLIPSIKKSANDLLAEMHDLKNIDGYEQEYKRLEKLISSFKRET